MMKSERTPTDRTSTGWRLRTYPQASGSCRLRSRFQRRWRRRRTVVQTRS